MGTPDAKLRITDETNDALKRVVSRFPRWSIAQLADALLVECCDFILDGTVARGLPTLDYIRTQIHTNPVPREKGLLQRIDELQNAVERIGSTRLNEEPDVGPPRKRKAG